VGTAGRVARFGRKAVPKLMKPRIEVKAAIGARIGAAKDLLEKTDLAESSGGYEDWLFGFEDWRGTTSSVLSTLYDTRDIAREFTASTQRGDHGSPRFNFPHGKRALELGIFVLERLIDRVDLAISETPDAVTLGNLHPQIIAGCRTLYEARAYAEAVEKGFKLVRARLRELTTYETGSDAFGRGHLYVEGAAAAHVDEEFQAGVKFLTMAIDRFRNEKSHTADGNIDDPIRAYEYLRLSSLALHLLDRARIVPET
jgi:uncharacterized protein (TIGR02391 family)